MDRWLGLLSGLCREVIVGAVRSGASQLLHIGTLIQTYENAEVGNPAGTT
jgi:hypothetical protein